MHPRTYAPAPMHPLARPLQMSNMRVGTQEETMACFSDYILKNYYKTGSLIANSCKACAAPRRAHMGGLTRPWVGWTGRCMGADLPAGWR